jgi:hypothetical protein
MASRGVLVIVMGALIWGRHDRRQLVAALKHRGLVERLRSSQPLNADEARRRLDSPLSSQRVTDATVGKSTPTGRPATMSEMAVEQALSRLSRRRELSGPEGRERSLVRVSREAS